MSVTNYTMYGFVFGFPMCKLYSAEAPTQEIVAQRYIEIPAIAYDGAKMMSEIIRYVDSAETPCGESVSPKYIKSQKLEYQMNKKNQYGALIFAKQLLKQTRRQMQVVSEPVGFLMFYKENATTVHLDIVCSKQGFGSVVINNFLSIMEKEYKYNVGLDALANVLLYYPKAFGFQYRQDCNSPTIQIPDALLHAALEESKAYITPQNKTGYPKSNGEAYSRGPWLDIMKYLQSQDLNVAKLVEKQKGQYVKCDRSHIDELAENNCAIDGFKQYRCTIQAPEMVVIQQKQRKSGKRKASEPKSIRRSKRIQ